MKNSAVQKLSIIIIIIIISCLCVQSWYLTLVALTLIARTYADVWMIQNGTAIERWGEDGSMGKTKSHSVFTLTSVSYLKVLKIEFQDFEFYKVYKRKCHLIKDKFCALHVGGGVSS